MPAVIAVEGMAQRAVFGELVGRPIVGRGGMAAEHQPAGGPDIDEVGHDPAAALRNEPHAGEVRACEEHDVRDEDGEADGLHKPRRP